MLRPTDYEPLLDDRKPKMPDQQPDRIPAKRRFGFGLRRRVGHALIGLGRMLAAEPATIRRSTHRRRAYRTY